MDIKPVLLAMVVCERIEDVGHEVTLHRVLSTIPVTRLPEPVERIALYLALTNVHRETTLDLHIHAGGKIIEESKLTMQAATPLDSVIATVRLDGITIPLPGGECVFDLAWKGEPLLSRRLPIVPT